MSSTRPFAYIRPTTIDEAGALLDEHGDDARLLLGGTDLVVALRHGAVSPEVVIDVKAVPELSGGIEVDGGVVRIPAGKAISDVIADTRIAGRFAALVDAGSVVGSIQIRNRATLAGNICNASPAADTVPVLLVEDAIVIASSSAGARRVPLDAFITGPGETVLEPNEIVTAIELPANGQGSGTAFARATRRRGHDLAIVNLACRVDASGRTRFAFGAAGPRAFIAEDVSGVLGDPNSDPAAREEAMGELVSQATPISDVRGSKEYREAMLFALGLRALDRALGRMAA